MCEQCNIATFQLLSLKSEVTIMFLDPNFLKDADILAIRIHLRQIYIFRTSWPRMGALGGNRLVFTFGDSYVCANFGEN